MEEFLEFTTTPDDLSVASPKRGYSLSVVKSSVVAYDVGNASVQQTSEEVNADVIEVSGTLKTASRVVQMYLSTLTLRGNKCYKVVFTVEAGTGGPYTVTFSTGLANRKSVVLNVPTSGQQPAMFDLYVDKVGNVFSSTASAPTPSYGLSMSDVYGLTLSNAADTDHDVTIAVGEARDSTNAVTLRVTSAITKRIDAPWSEGDGMGGLDTGVVAANSVYYVWIIYKATDKSLDAVFSLSKTAPTIASVYTHKRRIGTIITNASANIISFRQVDDRIYLKQPLCDRALALLANTSRNGCTLTAPPDMEAMVIVHIAAAAQANLYLWCDSWDRPDLAASVSNCDVELYEKGSYPAIGKTILTDGSSQVFARGSSTNIYFRLFTLGWIDDRGRDA